MSNIHGIPDNLNPNPNLLFNLARKNSNPIGDLFLLPMEKKLLNPRMALKHLKNKLQRLQVSQFIKFKALKNLYCLRKHVMQKGFSQSQELCMDKHYTQSSSSSIDRCHRYYSCVACKLEDEGDKVVFSVESTQSVSLQLQGVDAEAEKFIRRTKEAWMIEKQKSVEEFFEMLACST